MRTRTAPHHNAFRKYEIDYCVANVENAAGGFGVTKEICDEILDAGVDCLTSGNHIWDKRAFTPPRARVVAQRTERPSASLLIGSASAPGGRHELPGARMDGSL